jgi:hypothetical protein
MAMTGRCHRGGEPLPIPGRVLDPPTGQRILRNIRAEVKGDWYDVPPVRA